MEPRPFGGCCFLWVMKENKFDNEKKEKMLDELQLVLENCSHRLSWHEYFSAMTLLLAVRSPSPRLRVGAVLVKQNRVISAGYNGFPAGTPHTSVMREGHEVNTIHAEQNAISDAARRGVSIDGATLYVSHFPCIHCTKFAISSGIQQIYYKNDYRNDDVVAELCRLSGVGLERILS